LQLQDARIHFQSNPIGVLAYRNYRDSQAIIGRSGESGHSKKDNACKESDEMSSSILCWFSHDYGMKRMLTSDLKGAGIRSRKPEQLMKQAVVELNGNPVIAQITIRFAI
jgi:hypothetical protein